MPNQSTYKLLYLNLRGFGEPIRLLLHYKNVEFEDVRFDRKEFLASAELKKLTPYGRVPVLQIEGQRPIAQSGAILRYLARKFDLNGKNEEETVRADEIYGFFGDCTKNIVPYLVVHAGLSEGNKEQLYNETFIPAVQQFCQIYDQMLTDSKSGFLLPSGLTYVDFVIVEQLHTVDQASGSMLDSYPQLRQYKERVHALPGVRDYISERPNSLL